MSYTVIVDRAEERRQFENRINAVLRHCRIGKVVQKPRKSLADQLKNIKVRPTGWPGPGGAVQPYFFSHGLR
ncbi:hypothetical protein IB276_11710 [Ensifer sp. ENS04]|uniref:hypothetical protein n=1 Tax=Ensifer sp. ENS04 TaxID=2769281 RepID=UPI001785E71D|nr:hypothetical protein [Ensifer sp. ENS04]MBD9540120.1 hypothetical protein [Ensifer sp. ENS04]